MAPDQPATGTDSGATAPTRRVIHPDSGHGGLFQNDDDFVTRTLELL